MASRFGLRSKKHNRKLDILPKCSYLIFQIFERLLLKRELEAALDMKKAGLDIRRRRRGMVCTHFEDFVDMTKTYLHTAGYSIGLGAAESGTIVEPCLQVLKDPLQLR